MYSISDSPILFSWSLCSAAKGASSLSVLWKTMPAGWASRGRLGVANDVSTRRPLLYISEVGLRSTSQTGGPAVGGGSGGGCAATGGGATPGRVKAARAAARASTRTVAPPARERRGRPFQAIFERGATAFRNRRRRTGSGIHPAAVSIHGRVVGILRKRSAERKFGFSPKVPRRGVRSKAQETLHR